ncbi:hypothetical protein NIES4102_06940 [Chondrocystis sp. NIES-4102]|nr:hypothetical protein NIES4102_06940 [Chondrocystis sp. NIES-4102]
MTIYLVGIGGSGAKCVESVVHLASVGLFSQSPIKVLFVDADESNGNVERARNSLKIQTECQKILSGIERQDCPWMQTQIKSFDLWSPFAKNSLNKELSAFFNYNNLKQSEPALANLFDVLYTDREKQENLDVGFRGRPAIGAAVMSQVDLNRLDEEPWGTFIEQIKADVNEGRQPKVLLCGSIFGGTGASGLPTIARLIANKLNDLNIRERVKIGSVFILPYFGFTAPTGESENGIYAQSDKFLLNTEAALRYYVTQAQGIFDTVYLLGNENLARVNFSIGKNEQRNQPHFIELYAALAARHFLTENHPQQETIVLLSRSRSQYINWDDIPDGGNVQKILGSTTRFAYTWLASIAPELVNAKQEGFRTYIRCAPWLTRFYDTDPKKPLQFDSEKQQNAIAIINNWCKDYLRWLQEIHQCQSDQVQLFKQNVFAQIDKLEGTKLQDLLLGDHRDAKTRQRNDEPTRIKNSLNTKNVLGSNNGTVGLAQALYQACQL